MNDEQGSRVMSNDEVVVWYSKHWLDRQPNRWRLIEQFTKLSIPPIAAQKQVPAQDMIAFCRLTDGIHDAYVIGFNQKLMELVIFGHDFFGELNFTGLSLRDAGDYFVLDEDFVVQPLGTIWDEIGYEPPIDDESADPEAV